MTNQMNTPAEKSQRYGEAVSAHHLHRVRPKKSVNGQAARRHLQGAGDEILLQRLREKDFNKDPDKWIRSLRRRRQSQGGNCQ